MHLGFADYLPPQQLKQKENFKTQDSGEGVWSPSESWVSWAEVVMTSVGPPGIFV